MKQFKRTAFGFDVKSHLRYGETLRSKSKQIGISTSTLHRIINGYPMDLETALAVSSYFGMNLTDYYK